MSSGATMVTALQQCLSATATQHARSSGFCRRTSKVDAATFCEGLIFGWLQHPHATLAQLVQMLAARGVSVTPQGLDQRFTPASSRLLYAVLQAVSTVGIPADAPVAIPLLQRFAAVDLDDSSTITLPDALAGEWRGCGGPAEGSSTQGSAAVKLQVRLDLCQGMLTGPALQDGRAPDKTAPMQEASIRPNTLRIADLGYFSLAHLARRSAAGAYWLTRFQPQTVVYDATGTRWSPLDLPTLLEGQGSEALQLPITLGARTRIPGQLIAVRVPPAIATARRERLRSRAVAKRQAVSPASLALADWTILVTNATLSIAEALILLRARWQIEQLFRRWKDQGEIDTWRTANPWRILTELYAKLIGCVLQHWLTIATWEQPERSLTNAAQVVRDHAVRLLCALGSRRQLAAAIRTIHACLAVGCRINPRRRRLNTYQRLLRPSLEALA
jgi:hypothetical protein